MRTMRMLAGIGKSGKEKNETKNPAGETVRRGAFVNSRRWNSPDQTPATMARVMTHCVKTASGPAKPEFVHRISRLAIFCPFLRLFDSSSLRVAVLPTRPFAPMNPVGADVRRLNRCCRKDVTASSRRLLQLKASKCEIPFGGILSPARPAFPRRLRRAAGESRLNQGNPDQTRPQHPPRPLGEDLGGTPIIPKKASRR